MQVKKRKIIGCDNSITDAWDPIIISQLKVFGQDQY